MYLLLGNKHIESSDYQGAIQLFEHAQDQMQYYVGPPLISISLVCFLPITSHHLHASHCLQQISGWKFDDIGIKIQQRLCEALFAAGRTKKAGESLLNIVNTFDEKVYLV